MNRKSIIGLCISITTSICCIALTFWGNLKNDGILTIDSFIGIVATLIGVCTTIIVGFQIASYLELRETRKQVDILQKEREKLETITSNINNIRTELGNAFVVLGATTSDSLLKVMTGILSIYVSEYNDSISDCLLSRYELLERNLSTLEKDSKPSKPLAVFNDKLKKIVYPTELKDYDKIIRIHFDVIARIDRLTKEN